MLHHGGTRDTRPWQSLVGPLVDSLSTLGELLVDSWRALRGPLEGMLSQAWRLLLMGIKVEE